MNRARMCVVISISALAACERGKPEVGTNDISSLATDGRALQQDVALAALHDDASRPLTASEGGDAAVVRKVTAKLDPRDAEATFVAAPKVRLKGEARLNQRSDGVRVDVALTEGPPGTHGIHIHQKADCSDLESKSMGEHLAPERKPHGLPNTAAHHLGDLGNIEIGPDGTATFEIVVPEANLRKKHARSLLNRAVVIHEKPDIGTGKSGESGAPIACAAFVSE